MLCVSTWAWRIVTSLVLKFRLFSAGWFVQGECAPSHATSVVAHTSSTTADQTGEPDGDSAPQQ